MQVSNMAMLYGVNHEDKAENMRRVQDVYVSNVESANAVALCSEASAFLTLVSVLY